jgi:methylmalonyl-CoA mutase
MAPPDPTLEELPELEELFDLPALDDWRSIADAGLRGKPLDGLTTTTIEGFAISPLYTADDEVVDPGRPGRPPFVRGRTVEGPGEDGPGSCQRIHHPDPEIASAWGVEEVARGVGSLWLEIEPASRLKDDSPAPPRRGGIQIATGDDLERLFAGIDRRSTPMHLDAGADAVAVAAAVIASAQKHDIDPGELSGSFGCDPLGALAADGGLCSGLEGCLSQLVELARWTDEHAPDVRAVTVSSLPFHMAGGTAVQELAFGLATAVEYLRASDAHGLDPVGLCRQIGFRYAVGRDLFMEAAKLRAARKLWSRVAESCGAAENDRSAPIHAVASPRGLTTRDPWVNGLRTTVGAFAATVGGADLITVLPFDTAIGLPEELGRRVAANSLTILREESHLGRVVDPGGGSWYLEELTEELAEASWVRFQEIESAGGMGEMLLNGTIARELDRTRADREQAVATGRSPVTGVSSYPNLGEERIERESAVAEEPEITVPDVAIRELARLLRASASPTGDGAMIEAAIAAARAGASIAQLAAALRGTRARTVVGPLPAQRDSQVFERLRATSDAWLAAQGSRPRVFLANMGSPVDYRIRTTYATNFLESGGIEPIASEVCASAEDAVDRFRQSGTSVAVICSSDAAYDELVPELAPALEAAGARTVILAGEPGDREQIWRSAGVAGFIHEGCDQYQMLVDLLREEGVLHV